MNVDLSGRINGLDLFSGIGGISLALEPWVRTIAYCEADRYAQAVLLSRMADGELDVAPIWDDIRTLSGTMLPAIDIIFGGFPCQDISVAGAQKGIHAERSGLFFEIMRLAEEIKPAFIFLENVPAIRTNGLGVVIRELASLRYDCRWGVLSAFDVGAPHKRERWFMLAGKSKRSFANSTSFGVGDGEQEQQKFSLQANSKGIGNIKASDAVADSDFQRLQRRCECGECTSEWTSWPCGETFPGAWESNAGILRVAHGIPKRVDRIKCCGNSVVPIQAREAFKRLMGLA